MKIGKRADKLGRATNPDKNNSKKNLLLVLVIGITVALIVWVYTMGKKAEDTVSVVMWSEAVYKNQPITSNQVVEYKMLKAEFEKYAVTDSNGQKSRRLILWEERSLLGGTFAAYPLQANTLVMITDVIRSKTDNSDTVLYSFPGKNILALQLGDSDLSTFKTFIEPGDRVNITAIYSSEESVYDSDGNETKEKVEVTRQETVFKDILVADLLNSSGDSVLDKFAYYKTLTTYQQANLDVSDDWKKQIQPSKLLVALTPEEEALYYKYLSQSSVKFYMSLPQRME